MSNAFTIRQRPVDSRVRGPGAPLGRVIRPVLMILCTACALALLARFAVIPLLAIKHVVVQSDLALTEQEVLGLAGLQGSEYLLGVAPAAVEKRLEASPLVQRALVQKVFPDTLRITLWRRQPVALTLADVGGRSQAILIDETGIVFKVGVSRAEVDLPVVSGLSVGKMSLGNRLPRMYEPVFADLKALRDRFPALYRLISEVKIVSLASGREAAGGASAAASSTEYEILLYLTSSPVPIRAQGTIDESLLKYSLMVADLLSKQGILKNIQELDFRGGEVVYRLKEG